VALKERVATGPARERVGLPVLADGTARRPLLVGLDGVGRGRCNNGCDPCLSERVEATVPEDLRGRHVVVRHREPTLEPDLPRRLRALADRGPASLALLTNGRTLALPRVVPLLARAGVTRFVVKLFGLEASAHDAHCRVPGSFEQARAGIAAARAAGLPVLVTFPLDPGRAGPAHHDLARALTGFDAVEHPEPEVESHANEFRYDVVSLREGVHEPLWDEDNFFPMAHVHVGPFCNLRCTYCNVHGGDDPRLYDATYVEAILEAAAAQVLRASDGRGTPTVDFIGGEPTVHPELPRFIERARSLGFRKIYVCTNGTLLHRPGYLDRLVASGLTGVRYSLHDHRAEVAAQLADVEGLGDRYVQVAKMLLARRDLHVHLYRIILAGTIDALPDYVRWLAAHDRTGRPLDLTFGMPSMRGRLFENRELYPPLGGLREKVAEAIALARTFGAEPLVHHAPACLVPDEPRRVACLHVETTQVDAPTGARKVMSFEGDARFGRACERCDARGRGCHGLPAAYWESDPDAAERWLTPLRGHSRLANSPKSLGS
jgi:MoaA/NifB/PqqE/SkfB family radical SAM enzyme